MYQPIPHPHQLSTIISEYLTARRRDGYSPLTIEGYGYQLKRLLEHLGDQALEDIKLDDLRESLGRLEHLKASSRGFTVRSYRAFFRWAHEEELIAWNPAIKLKEPKQPQRIPKHLTIEAVELLRDACQAPIEHALIELLFATGCRIGEVHQIDRDDLDWQRSAIIVLGKGSKEREVYYGARAGIWLRRYLDARTDTCPALIATTRRVKQRNGELRHQRMSISQIQVVVKRVATRCDLQDRVTPHVLRHTLATVLINQGAPLSAVQSLLGHSKPETTQLYATLSGSAREQAYKRYFVQ